MNKIVVAMIRKINRKIWVLALLFPASLVSCDKYLDKTPEAGVTAEDIFSTYTSFQGFEDQMYSFLLEPNASNNSQGAENGDHTIAFMSWSSANKFAQGSYWSLFPAGNSNYWSTKSNYNNFGVAHGIWPSGWAGIRVANMALEKLPMLVDATEEERNLIEGQAYFFRAYFHWTICERWGGIPYVDHVYQPDEDMHIPRLTFQATVDRIAEDFEKAASLLPDDWDNTTVGGQFKGFNAGRATKGAALAFKAKALMFAGSPLMNHETQGSYTNNQHYMEEAAKAAWEVIKLADNGVYELTPFPEIQNNFARIDGFMPWTKETIFQKVNTWVGAGKFRSHHGWLYNPARFGGNATCETPTQNLVDMFEMTNGLPIEDPASGYDPMHPWDNRDPRLHEFILTDQEKAGISNKTICEFYIGGIDKSNPQVLTSYFERKFWPRGANKYDKKWGKYRYATPLMRLAEVYLIYAEAANEAWGPSGTAPGASLTAVDALNIVRHRAGMPDVAAKFTDSKENFRKRVWNERSVELCFEGQRWNDIRRWHVAHLPEYKILYDLDFDKDHTFFNRVVRYTRIFEERHYWFPFPKEQTQIYKEWPQNPGW